MNWEDLEPWQRVEGLIAFSESDHPPCCEEEFYDWIIKYIEELYGEKNASQSRLCKE